MKIIYDGIISDSEKLSVEELSRKCGIRYDTARLLYCRKIDSVQKVKEFLNPDKSGFIDPFLLNGVKEGVERIKKARENNERVFIFGDYDADGVCAVSVLYYCLKEYGITADYTVPEREDGYGLNVETLSKLNSEKKIDLLITVDCGISDKEKIEQIKAMGIDVIVTDHHEPPEDLPLCITLNPKIAGQKYGFSGLCGAGVAYKLGYAVIGDRADKYLDLVALATVSDSMELVGENRNIVAEGLKIFNSDKLRFAFKCILGENDKQITSQTLAYNIAPKINAGGRMGDANSSLKLFLTDSVAETSKMADLLKTYNVNRQIACDEIFKEAKAEIEKLKISNDNVICVYKEGWKTGFIGIAAARLVEEYSRPVIVFAETNDALKGSARSVEGVSIFEIISSAKDLLEGFGGHSQAAGVTVKKENFEALRNRLNGFVEEKYKGYDFSKKIHVDLKCEKPMDVEFAKEIELLGPFGVGNRRPVFATEVNKVNVSPLKNGLHFSFDTPVLEMLNFNGEKDNEVLSMPIKKTVVFETNVSVFKNRESVKGFVKKVVPEYDFSLLEYFVFDNELKKILNNGFDVGKVKDIKEFNSEKGERTVYLLSDYKNLSEYKNLNLPVSLYAPEDGSGRDCIVVSAKCIPTVYDNAVYLDKPPVFLDTNAKCYCNFDLCGYKFSENISVDRNVITEYYNELRNLKYKEYENAVSLYERNGIEKEKFNFIFVLNVFIELGIFKVENKILKLDSSVKNPLGNSKIYQTISMLKA